MATVTNLSKQLGIIEILLDERAKPVAVPVDSQLTVPVVSTQVVHIHNHQVPVCQWGFKFSGYRSDGSVNAFLERVEECRMARGVSEIELLNSIVELLEGSALIWFRSVRNQIQTWSEFVARLRKEF